LYAKALKSAGWDRTSDGLLYRSCLHVVPPGATLDPASDQIVLKNEKVQTFASCPYPRLIQPGQSGDSGNIGASGSSGTVQLEGRRKLGTGDSVPPGSTLT
jgi:hypothetical protein